MEDIIEELSARLFTVEETARLLHAKPQTIHNWLSLGKLKRVKIGSKTFVDRKEIEGILKNALDR
jgi:excisionase family DNA binding protein